MTMKNGLAVALMSTLLAVTGAAVAQTDQETGLEHLVIEMATTSTQHHAVAAHYAAKAAEARDEVRRHESMARAYGRGKTARPDMRTHCLQLARNYEQIATEYDALAKLHEAEAGRAPQ
jgi:hypothetical protein